MLITTERKKVDLAGLVWTDSERMSGAPCFAGTRVPVQNLFDYLEGGESIESFLDDFEGVSREQSLRVIEQRRSALFAISKTREDIPRSLRAEADHGLPKRARGPHRLSDAMGRKKNGELLRLAEQEFDVFLTVDQNLRHQQNFKSTSLRIVVLIAERNDYDHLAALIPKLIEALPKLV